MAEYVAPAVTVLGTVTELTQTTINKASGSGDMIVINGVAEPINGSSVTSLS